MTAKHAPGPWKLTQQGHWPFSLITRAADDQVIAVRELASDNTSDKLACHANRRPGNAKVIANETLRAAAPELLEALREMTALFEMTDEAQQPGTDSYAILHQAREAIAKATSTAAEG